MASAVNIIFSNFFVLMDKTKEIDGSSSNWSSTFGMLGQFFFLILIFAIIIACAVFSLRLAAKFNNYGRVNSNLRIIESRMLSTNAYIHIVKAGEKYVLVGSSKENVTFLTEIDGEKINDDVAIKSGGGSKQAFEKQLASQMKKLFGKDGAPKE